MLLFIYIYRYSCSCFVCVCVCSFIAAIYGHVPGVYLAPEDDNRLQINCNHIALHRSQETWPGLGGYSVWGYESCTKVLRGVYNKVRFCTNLHRPLIHILNLIRSAVLRLPLDSPPKLM